MVNIEGSFYQNKLITTMHKIKIACYDLVDESEIVEIVFICRNGSQDGKSEVDISAIHLWKFMPVIAMVALNFGLFTGP